MDLGDGDAFLIFALKLYAKWLDLERKYLGLMKIKDNSLNIVIIF